MSSSHLSAKVTAMASTSGGMGTFALEPIERGETVAAFGGRCITRARLITLPRDRQSRSLQIDDELYLAGESQPEPGDWINHSCQPNCGMRGGVVLVAMREIAPGEEITYDYAMTDGSDYDEFECACATEGCRQKVTGNDWMIPELQVRYRGYFSPYLAARISALVAVGAERRAFAY